MLPRRRPRRPRVPLVELFMFLGILATSIGIPQLSLFVRLPPQASAARRSGLHALDSASNNAKIIVVASDATGETAKLLLNGVLAQFEDPGNIELLHASKVTTSDQLHSLIESVGHKGGTAIILSTFLDATLVGLAKSFCKDAGIQYIDVMSPLLDNFSKFLAEPGAESAARFSERRVANLVSREFLGMVEAVKYGQKHISGLNPQGWAEADVVLVGPSRVDKGAISLELARRGLKAASLNISPYDPVPEEIHSLQPHKVGLVTMDEQRLIQLRKCRAEDMQRHNLHMLLEPDYCHPDRVRKDLELLKLLRAQHPDWPDTVDATYRAIPETASILFDRVRAWKRMMPTVSGGK